MTCPPDCTCLLCQGDIDEILDRIRFGIPGDDDARAHNGERERAKTHCPAGHPYQTESRPGRRRRCTVCENIAKRAARARSRGGSDPHPWRGRMRPKAA